MGAAGRGYVSPANTRTLPRELSLPCSVRKVHGGGEDRGAFFGAGSLKPEARLRRPQVCSEAEAARASRVR